MTFLSGASDLTDAFSALGDFLSVFWQSSWYPYILLAFLVLFILWLLTSLLSEL